MRPQTARRSLDACAARSPLVVTAPQHPCPGQGCRAPPRALHSCARTDKICVHRICVLLSPPSPGALPHGKAPHPRTTAAVQSKRPPCKERYNTVQSFWGGEFMVRVQHLARAEKQQAAQRAKCVHCSLYRAKWATAAVGAPRAVQAARARLEVAARASHGSGDTARARGHSC